VHNFASDDMLLVVSSVLGKESIVHSGSRPLHNNGKTDGSTSYTSKPMSVSVYIIILV